MARGRWWRRLFGSLAETAILNYYSLMTVTEMKMELSRMTPAEREELSAFLAIQSRIDDPEWGEKMKRRFADMDAGNAYSEEDMLALEAKLQAEGR